MLAHPPLENASPASSTSSLLEVMPWPRQTGLPLGEGQEQKVLLVAVGVSCTRGWAQAPHHTQLSPSSSGHTGGSKHAGRVHGHLGSPACSSPGATVYHCPSSGHSLRMASWPLDRCVDAQMPTWQAARRGVPPAIHAGEGSVPPSLQHPPSVENIGNRPTTSN